MFAGRNWGGPCHALDVTHPDAGDFLAEVLRPVVEAGFTFLKLDFLFAAALPGHRRDDSLSGEAAYRHGVETVRRIVGDDVYLLACGAPVIASLGVFDGIRIGPDVAPWWEQADVTRYLHDVTAPSTRYAVATSAHRLWLSAVIDTDPDVAYFRSRQCLLTAEQTDAAPGPRPDRRVPGDLRSARAGSTTPNGPTSARSWPACRRWSTAAVIGTSSTDATSISAPSPSSHRATSTGCRRDDPADTASTRPSPPRRPGLPHLRPPGRLGPLRRRRHAVRPFRAPPPPRSSHRLVGARVAHPQRPSQCDHELATSIRSARSVPAAPSCRDPTRLPSSTTATRPSPSTRPPPMAATIAWQPARGRALVVAHTDQHVVRTGDLSARQLAAVMAVLREHTASLWRDGWSYVMAFENHGTEVGATLPHQHGQVYALDHIPPVIAAKRAALERHRAGAGTCLGCTLVAEDLPSDRVVEVGEHFVAAVPFAARWPYAVEVRARRHGVGRLGDLDDDAALELARLLAAVLDRFDGLWSVRPALHAVRAGGAARRGSRPVRRRRTGTSTSSCSHRTATRTG